ncbi:WhiB family transcriptional regulator [Streptomyces sp. NPDC055109]
MSGGLGYREDWWLGAVCAGDLERFFRASPVAAAAICRTCPVRAECLYDALDADAPNGVWGGLIRAERRKIPELPAPRSAAIAALRDLLDSLDPVEDEPEHTERTTEMDNAIPAPRPAEATKEQEPTLPALLVWAADHADAKIRKAAAQAQDSLGILRTRHRADEQLASIDEEAARLERRLAELQQRKADIAPKAKPKASARDYDLADVRAWATAQGTDVAPRGRVPKKVVDAWRAAGAPTRQQ